MKTHVNLRRTAALLLALLTAISALSALSACSEKGPFAYVNIADGDGNLVMSMVPVKLTDVDSDEKLTVNDVLTAAHDAAFKGGAEAGYKSEKTEWGLSITKLWGIENGGSYGYSVNNSASMSLEDPVNENDVVTAYIWRDGISPLFFDKSFAEVKKGEKLTLTLYASGYDENWNPVQTPVEGAEITVDGKATGVKTGADGKAEIEIGRGTHLISATLADAVTVPPACKVTVK